MQSLASRPISLPEVTELRRAKPILASINWNFSTPFSVGRSGVKLFDCRKHHWFPATFVPEIPYTLIEVLSKPGAVVYDPFAGIGTAIFQALLLGRRPYGTEVCRVAVDFMKSMWILFNPETDISGLTRYVTRVEALYNTRVDYGGMLLGSHVDVERLRPWFRAETFNQLMYLALCELRCRKAGYKAASRIAISAILKAVCAQDRGWGCVADNVLPKPDQLKTPRNALDRFRRNVGVLAKSLEEVRATLSSWTLALISSTEVDAHVAKADVRQCAHVPSESVDLIVTSPPYPNMTDYCTSQRLSYYWLGADPKDDLVSEIGARRRRFSPNSVQEYRDCMQNAMGAIGKSLKPGGYACFVMPTFEAEGENNNERKRAVHDCLSFLASNGFVLEQELSRILPARRRHHNQKWATLERESIYVYRKAR